MSSQLENQRGIILITVLLLLLIVTLLGIIAVDTSTVDLQISGNVKRGSIAFEGAEAGVDLSVPVIEQTMANGTLTPASITVEGTAATIDGSLVTEITTQSTDAEKTAFDGDITGITLQNVAVNVDIDRLYSVSVEGSSNEFAAGYEGVGAGAAGGGIGVLFRVTSRGKR